MYHSITIGDKNTWDDWKMIPVSRPVVAPRWKKSSLWTYPDETEPPTFPRA